MDENSNIRGWVLYDDTCGFCRSWVPYWRDTLAKQGLDIAPLQSPWVAEKLSLPPETVSDNLRLLLADGTLIEGANVYRYAMKRIWWAFPFYLLSVIPGTSHLFDLGYSIFRRNRHRISRTCGLR